MDKYIDLVKNWFTININSDSIYNKGKVVFVSIFILLVFVKLLSLIF